AEPESSFATPAALERAARAWAEQQEIKFGHFVGPVRAVLTGTNKGPGFFDVVFLLGKEACVRRLRKHAAE
ncbi:MAG: glutamyl-tRNA synthetase, partial [Neolewinella sp.]